MNTYIITDSDGNLVNKIVSTLEFAQQAYPNCTYEVSRIEGITEEEQHEQNSRDWRDTELSSSDWIVPVTDHPQHAAYMAYRVELRDWPSTADFPDTRPTLGS